MSEVWVAPDASSGVARSNPHPSATRSSFTFTSLWGAGRRGARSTLTIVILIT